MNINPFILSQVGEKQNELILNINAIKKDELSNSIYSFYNALKNKCTFLRCYKIGDEIVAAYYWKTNHLEEGSNRSGLYVIIGFIIKEFCMRDFDLFVLYSSNFFRILENNIEISMLENSSDHLFEEIQIDTDYKMERLKDKCNNLDCVFPLGHFDKSCYIYKFLKKEKIKSMQYLYMLNNEYDFFADWTVFMYEAFRIVDLIGFGDVSSLEGYTTYSLQILENGDKIPPNIGNKIMSKEYKDYKYLIWS